VRIYLEGGGAATADPCTSSLRFI